MAVVDQTLILGLIITQASQDVTALCSLSSTSSWNFKAKATMSLTKLKEKMTKLKDDTEQAEEREADAKSLLKDTNEKVERDKTEAEGLKRRITLLKADLAKTTERLEEAEGKLGEITQKGENEEMVRKELEEVEVEGDEKISMLEESCVEAAKEREEKVHLLNEATRRMVVIKRDLQTAKEKEEKYLDTYEKLKDTLRNFTEQTKELEELDEEASEKEQLSEEKMGFLKEQVKEANGRAEVAEREVCKLERLKDETTSEIKNWGGKIKEIIQEMDDITCLDDEM